MGYTISRHHGNYNIVRRVTAVRYIVVHYVGAGTSAPGSALANCKYFAGGNRQASAHYFIDDANIYEYAEPRAYATWHCGDGRGRYGITNQNSIGIEVCNNGGPYTDAEVSRLAWLVKKLMSDFGVPASHVVRHYDASRKQCPLYYVQHGDAWAKLQAQITGYAPVPDAPNAGLGDTSWTGPLMWRELESQLSLTPTGTMSGQSDYNRTKVQVRIERGLYDCGYTKHGSTCVRALQAMLGVEVDGQLGHGTVRALQTWLNDKIGAGLDIDGYYGPATSRAVGSALESGAFKAGARK